MAVVPSVAGRVLTPGSSTAPAPAGPSGTAAVQLYSVQCTPCSTAHACCAVLHRNVTPVLLLHHRTPPPSPVTLSDSLYYYTHFYYALSTLSTINQTTEAVLLLLLLPTQIFFTSCIRGLHLHIVPIFGKLKLYKQSKDVLLKAKVKSTILQYNPK